MAVEMVCMVRSVPIDAIRPNPYQNRRAIEPLDDLAASIREHGVLQPVMLRSAGDGFELVAGERRWRAAAQAGLTQIPAVVRELSDREAAILCLVENLQRQDLHFFEEAAGYERLIDEFQLRQEDLAAQIGRSQALVANKLRLLRLEDDVREVVSRAGLSERHARLLLKLPAGGDRLRAAETIARRGLTVREAERWVDGLLAAGVPDRRGRRVRGVIRDLRIVVNGIRHTAQQLRENGFAASVEEEEQPDAWVVHLRIAKQRRIK